MRPVICTELAEVVDFSLSLWWMDGLYVGFFIPFFRSVVFAVAAVAAV